MDFVGKVMLERIEEPVDAVITTSAGYPLDLTFYQTVKGITAASHIVKPGGRILVISACTEGAGAPEFCEMLERFPTPQAFLDHVAENPVVVDQWQLEKLALVCRDKQLFFHVPGLESQYQTKLWGPTFASVNEAVTAALAGLGEGARIAVIPEGPYVLARVEEGVLA
jgi:nickel-dependent lactate racemase